MSSIPRKMRHTAEISVLLPASTRLENGASWWEEEKASLKYLLVGSIFPVFTLLTLAYTIYFRNAGLGCQVQIPGDYTGNSYKNLIFPWLWLWVTSSVLSLGRPSLQVETSHRFVYSGLIFCCPVKNINTTNLLVISETLKGRHICETYSSFHLPNP